MERREAWLRTGYLKDLSPGKLRELLLRAGGPEELFRIPPDTLFSLGVPLTFTETGHISAVREMKISSEEELAGRGISFVTEEDETYPERLMDLEDWPPVLFYRGRLPEPGLPAAAVIGSRTCTEYGKEMAFFLARSLAERGVTVVSGMALGVDGYAGRGALSSGRSAAVLGSGADVCYPRENIDLYAGLLEKGTVFSEMPPGHHARPADFPRRNRLISGLSDVLVVVEAAEKSGTLITVNCALAANREVFALPGRVNDRMSRGCNQLIRSGAQILTCPEDVLQYLGIRVEKETVKKRRVNLPKNEQAVYELFTEDTLQTDTLLEKSALPIGTLSEILLRLQIKGLIQKSGTGGYMKT